MSEIVLFVFTHSMIHETMRKDPRFFPQVPTCSDAGAGDGAFSPPGPGILLPAPPPAAYKGDNNSQMKNNQLWFAEDEQPRPPCWALTNFDECKDRWVKFHKECKYMNLQAPGQEPGEEHEDKEMKALR